MRSTDDRPDSTSSRPLAFLTSAAVAVFVAAGCGGEGGAAAAADDGRAGPPPSAFASEEIRGPIDREMAARGEEVFRERGCAACHRLQDRLVGPPLAGVTTRRDYGWFRHMVVNPDSMVRGDSTARAMLAEYMVPMPDQGVTDEEARALFEYFRSEDGGSEVPPAAAADGGEAATRGGS